MRRWLEGLKGLRVLGPAAVLCLPLLLPLFVALELGRSPGKAEAVGDAIQAEWDFTVDVFHAVTDLPSRMLTDQPPCEPVPQTTDQPPTAAYTATSDNGFLVSVQHASCVEVSFAVPRAPDLHYRWEIPTALASEQHWRSGQIWATDAMRVPYTVTAVGPGGTTALTGDAEFRRG